MSESDASPVAAAAPSGSALTPSSSNGPQVTFEKELFDQVEIVYQRLTKGRHDLKRVKAYMEARGEMARTFVKSFKKATEQPDLEDSSSIGGVWKEIRDTGAAQMKQQEMFAAGCTDISAVLETQIVEVKKSKTALHATWTKLVADVKKKQLTHDKSKDVYYESVKQAETAVMNRDAAHEQRLADKAVQKAEARAKSCLKEVETLHAAYQKAVSQLQEAQSVHDVTVADLLMQFEKLERARLRVFFEQLNRFAGQHDSLLLGLDQSTKSLHQNVDGVNIPNDMQEFIRAHTTGKTPAAHVEYIPCRSQIIDHAMDMKPSNSGALPVVASNFSSSPMANAPSTPAHGDAAPIAAGAVLGAGASASGTGETAVALYDFDQNEVDDLPFKMGDVIKLLSSPDGEDWWQGEKDGRIGIFPKAYVSKQGGASAPGGAPIPSNVPASSIAPPPAAPALVVPPPAAPASNSNPFGDDDDFGGKSAGAAASPGASSEGVVVAAGDAEIPQPLNAQCAALFDFDGQDDDELSFKVGQMLIITGELNGWYLGRVDGTAKIGIFPSNYVQMNQ